MANRVPFALALFLLLPSGLLGASAQGAPKSSAKSSWALRPAPADDTYIGIGTITAATRDCVTRNGGVIELCDPRTFDQWNPEGFGGLSSTTWSDIADLVDHARVTALRDWIEFTIPAGPKHPSWYAEIGMHLGGSILTREAILRDPVKVRTELELGERVPGVWVRDVFEPGPRVHGGYNPMTLLGVFLNDYLAELIPEVHWNVYMTRRYQLKQEYANDLVGHLKRDVELLAMTPEKYLELKQGIPENEFVAGESLEIEAFFDLTATAGPVPLIGNWPPFSWLSIQGAGAAGYSASWVLWHFHTTLEALGQGKWRLVLDKVLGHKHGPFFQLGPNFMVWLINDGPSILKLSQTWSSNTEDIVQYTVDSSQPGVAEAMRAAALKGTPDKLRKIHDDPAIPPGAVTLDLTEHVQPTKSNFNFSFFTLGKKRERTQVGLTRDRYTPGRAGPTKFHAGLDGSSEDGQGLIASFSGQLGFISDRAPPAPDAPARAPSLRVHFTFSSGSPKREELLERLRSANTLLPANDPANTEILRKATANALALGPKAHGQSLKSDFYLMFDPFAVAAVAEPEFGAEYYGAWWDAYDPGHAMPPDWPAFDEDARYGWLNAHAADGNAPMRRRLLAARDLLEALRAAARQSRRPDRANTIFKAIHRSHADLYPFAALASCHLPKAHLFSAVSLSLQDGPAGSYRYVNFGGPGPKFVPPVSPEP